MQFQADILGVPVVRPAITETTALGAAFLAGLAAGFWRGLKEISELPQERRRFEPRMRRSEADNLRERWNEAVSRTKAWVRP